jgi:hypothetical protein
MNAVELLRKAVLVERSQAAVASKLHYSPAVISQVLKGTYQGSTEAVAAAITHIYGGKLMQQQEAIPDGYKQNAVGHLVPLESIKEIDLARDEFVIRMVDKAKEMQRTLEVFKASVRDDFQAFVDLSAEQYNASLGGEKGNISLKSFDGSMEVSRDVSEMIEFDERLNVAKSLVDDCLREWTKNSDSKIRTLVDSAFQVDKKGNVNTKRILGLRKLSIDDDNWKRAMEAISDAVTVTGTRVYFRFYERGSEHDKLEQINLDFSGV